MVTDADVVAVVEGGGGPDPLMLDVDGVPMRGTVAPVNAGAGYTTAGKHI